MVTHKKKYKSILKTKSKHVSTAEAAALLNSSVSVVAKYYHKGWLKGFQAQKGKAIMILKTSIRQFIVKQKKLTEKEKSYVTVKEAAAVLNVNVSRIWNYYHKGYFLDGFKPNKTGPLMVFKKSLDLMLKKQKENQQIYISTAEAAALLKISIAKVRSYFHKDFLDGSQIGEHYPIMILKSCVKDFLIRQNNKKTLHFYSTDLLCSKKFLDEE